MKQAYGFTAANILSDEEKFGILRELTLNYGGDLAEEGDFPEEIAREISVVKGNKIALEHYYLHAVRMKCSDRFTRDTVKPVRADVNWILMI